jgi:hypothetical protein
MTQNTLPLLPSSDSEILLQSMEISAVSQSGDQNIRSKKDEEEPRTMSKIIRKLDVKLIPFLFLLELVFFHQRTTIGMNINSALSLSFQLHYNIRFLLFVGNAKTLGIVENLNLTDDQFKWAVAAFHYGYVSYYILLLKT